MVTFPSPGDLPDPGINPTSPALARGFFTLHNLGSPSPFPSTELISQLTFPLLTFSHSLGRHHDIFIAKCFQFSSVVQSCLTLCDPTDCSTLGFLVPHQLLELAQTHVHQVGDAMQPLHLLSSPSPPTFNLSQHQGLLQ